MFVTSAAIAMVAIDLGRRILANNDEARFALLAQDVLDRGAWLVPELNGAAYTNKPPLLAWLIALASWPVGHVTQLTAVLPSAVAAVVTAMVVYAAGRRLFGTTAGALAALAAITTQGWFLHARLPMPDMLVTLFITVAVVLLWRAVERPAGLWWIGFWASMAVAFWAKGAAALLPLAVALAWGVAARRPGWWRALHAPAGVVLFIALIAPWWLGQLASQGEALRETVVADNLLWYLPRSPAVFAAPPQHLVGILFPWVIVLPVAVWQAARASRERGSDRGALLFLLAWIFALLVAVGVAQQQRLRYYLPLVPPAALLIGWWAARAVEPGRDRRMPPIVYAAVAALVALATAIAALTRHSWVMGTHEGLPTSAIEIAVLAAALVLMLTALGYGVRRRRLAPAFAVACVGTGVWVAGWYHSELERRNAANDYPRLGTEARRLLPEHPVVAAWGVYDLPLAFYLGHQVRQLHTDRDLHRVMSEYPKSSAVLTEAALAQVEDRARLQVLPLDRANFGSIVLVSYRPEAPSPDTRR